ncbi:MAG: hypothetical protein ABSD75_24615 [Terriglobales bacterium]|jgi:hypothetical protein
MNDPGLTFLDGLLWYLETRNWAFEKLTICPIGSQALDIKMYHYLYFSNLFGAVDLVCDYGKEIGEKADFEEAIRLGFGNTNDYLYGRELRNAIVHRGLDPAAAGHADNNVLFILCPSEVHDRWGKKKYSCTFKYTVQLAECCNRIVNAGIFEFLDVHGFLNRDGPVINKEETLEAIKNAEAMPDWAKAMAVQAFDNIDFAEMTATIAATRIEHLKDLLGHK